MTVIDLNEHLIVKQKKPVYYQECGNILTSQHDFHDACLEFKNMKSVQKLSGVFPTFYQYSIHPEIEMVHVMFRYLCNMEYDVGEIKYKQITSCPFTNWHIQQSAPLSDFSAATIFNFTRAEMAGRILVQTNDWNMQHQHQLPWLSLIHPYISYYCSQYNYFKYRKHLADKYCDIDTQDWWYIHLQSLKVINDFILPGGITL